MGCSASSNKYKIRSNMCDIDVIKNTLINDFPGCHDYRYNHIITIITAYDLYLLRLNHTDACKDYLLNVIKMSDADYKLCMKTLLNIDTL
jgi:hypothetical protein